MKVIILHIFLAFPFLSWGQFHFKEKPDIQVFDLNGELKMALAGGINSAQYQKMDMNNDGTADLVIYDRTAKRISVFLVEANQFQYAPGYSSIFPDDVEHWLVLRDYDCDGDKDLFTSSIFGMKLYENTGFDGVRINWLLVQDPINTLGFSSVINLQMNSSDIPAIEDIDGDGDLDILVFDFTGSGSIEFHENQGGCGTLDYVRQTKTWGEFVECNCSTYDFGSGCTDIPAGRLTHVASYSLLITDLNNDGSADLLMGQEGCDDLDFLSNNGTSINADFNEFYNGYPFNEPANVATFPAAFMEDMDFDGIKDLVISTNTNSAFDLEVAFDSTSRLYKNFGTNQLPDFQITDESFLQGDMLDLGENAAPAFFDYDRDGDLDLFIGCKGVQFSDGFYSTIYYFENTGTESLPILTLRDRDFANLSTQKYTHIKPYFADLDHNGMKDLAFVATTNFTQTELHYITNSSQGGTHEFQIANLQTTNLPLSEGDTPAFFNYNSDVYADILVGKNSGALDLYISDSPGSFTLLESSFLGVDPNPARRNLRPAIGDLDLDGNLDLVITDSGKEIEIFSDFLSSQTLQEGEEDWLENEVLMSFIPADFGLNAHIAIENISASAFPEIIVGSTMGGVHFLENQQAGEVITDLEVVIFPNPVTSGNVSLVSNKDVSLEILNTLGAKVHSGIIVRSDEIFEMQTFNLLPGIYFFKFETSNQSQTIRVLVMH